MNKYKKQQKQIRKARKIKKMCLAKVAYRTKEESYQKGQRAYLCPYCEMWHRSGKMARLIAEIKKKVVNLQIKKYIL